MFEKVIIKNKFTRRINGGHLWVFSNEVVKVPSLPNGEIVEVVNETGNSYGLAFFNPNSLNFSPSWKMI
jgi:23S rRNA (cytosine1962-C5)-methyltransferase